MSNENTGGNAFPIPGLQSDPEFNGMSLRDYFAAKAMQGLIQNNGMAIPKSIARDSYAYADAILAERAK